MTSLDPPPPEAPLPEGRRLRVVAIPHADPYVDAVLPPDVERVGPLGDPSPWLDEAYLTDRAQDVDVLHLHAGPSDLAERSLGCWTETVRRLDVPLVVTVHHLPAASGDEAAPIEAVLATAEVVLTLTPGAADEIAERYGRTAIVVAHPSLAAADPELGSERGLVGLRLVSPSTGGPDPVALVRAALSGAVSGGGRLRVLVPSGEEAGLPPEVLDREQAGELELAEYRPEEWPARLQQLHVAVLPEPVGVHSRDLEICRDVGTRVVAPGGGWFADQWSDVVTYGADATDGLDAVSLTAAVSAALARPMPRPADQVWRTEQREAVRRVHADVYAQVAGDRRLA